MPADLKLREVAKQIVKKCERIYDQTEAKEEFVASRLSEVRAQAMEEAADAWREEHKVINSPEERWLRRRASGKDEE
jgi:hypothetical protein